MYPDVPSRDVSSYLKTKRFFDIVFSLLFFVLLSPLILLIGIIIKLENPSAPVLYRSKRVGKDFKTFDFYKFRSMHPFAEKQLNRVKENNLYNSIETTPSMSHSLHKTMSNDNDSSLALFSDEGWVSEKTFLFDEEYNTKHNFVKIKGDPRITWIGKIIRKISLDELPQLWNVFNGDMSIVGNRPLPLYEAEKLTTDEFILRFVAPAGITGLWQVTESGKGRTDSYSRKMLDVEYAKRCSFWLDIYILFKTPLALFQHESE